MTSILIRCDASLLIGSGHVMRCRTLARELCVGGADVSFLCRRQTGDLISLLKSEFQVYVLPELPLLSTTSSDGTPLQGRDLYNAWLGCSQDQDVADCLDSLRRGGSKCPDWLVVDHYGLDARWESLLLTGLADSTISPKLFVIDDLADRPHKADVLLDQNFFGEATYERYKSLVPQHCLHLLGPSYALLAPEYLLLHRLLPPRCELRRVFVFFGAVDSGNLTTLALEVLSDPAFNNISVDVVLGLQSPHRKSITKYAALRSNVMLYEPLPSLAGLMARADLSIGAVGSTTWERACLGLPTIAIPSADNQALVAKALAQQDYIQLVPFEAKSTKEDLLHAAKLYISNDYIHNASLRCKSLTMGEGTEICSRLLLKSR